MRPDDGSQRAFSLRTTLRPGDLGAMVHMHGVVYAREYGFDPTLEVYVAGPLAAFVRSHTDRPGCGSLSVAIARQSWAYPPRFFADFFLVTNGAYIAGGAFDRVGDAGQRLRHGSPLWSLLAFGVVTVPTGVWLWHRQGAHFGLAAARGEVNIIAACSCFAVLIALIVLGLI